ncbi:MCP four helix bundle domain-containing protein [Halomonas sp. ANAO-440]|uniref:methyl-accepting chemotaxis protein n=1 Tax=Halomonas sp. ANAO-440 TaxID=2861360 RepID=UPI001CAA5519|nr:methyl-accepting chemotaxis protein [Halomonas sp. ANAO-440]MBZ0332261.1 MCP four helix bundle domain-containing protein [Halomonas sp. ANAO-440]
MNLTIKARLTVLITLLVALIAIVGSLGIRGMTALSSAIDTIYEDRLVPVQQLTRIDELMRDTIIELNQISLTNDHAGGEAASQTNRQPYLDAVGANIAAMEQVWTTYMATFLTPREAELAERYADQRRAFLQQGVEPAIALYEAGQIDQASAHMIEATRPAFVAANQTLHELIDLQGEVARAEYAAAQSTSDFMRLLTAAMIVLALIIASLGGWTLIRAITRPLGRMIEYFQAIAAGSLDNRIEVERRDEIGLALQSLSETQSQQRELVARIQFSAQAIHAASSEISSGNHDLSQRTEEQAASLQETATSMEQVASTVKQNADNTRQANELARNARLLADNGGDKTAQAMGKMQELEESAEKIGSIISVIDGIAFQTNILALNASVEAARAGEQGRGFAVVAGEVRNLAQRCATAAKEIQTLVTLDGELVKDGSALVKQAGEAMEQVVGSVRQVSELMADINAASEEQSQAVEQVSVAVSQMDQVTQQNAALVEQSAAAASSLQTQAELLANAVSSFRMGEKSSSSTTGNLAPAIPSSFISSNQVEMDRDPMPRSRQQRKTAEEPEWEAF